VYRHTQNANTFKNFISESETGFKELLQREKLRKSDVHHPLASQRLAHRGAGLEHAALDAAEG